MTEAQKKVEAPKESGQEIIDNLNSLTQAELEKLQTMSKEEIDKNPEHKKNIQAELGAYLLRTDKSQDSYIFVLAKKLLGNEVDPNSLKKVAVQRFYDAMMSMGVDKMSKKDIKDNMKKMDLRGSDMARGLQNFLKDANALDGKVDGYFGANSWEAMQKYFQNPLNQAEVRAPAESQSNVGQPKPEGKVERSPQAQEGGWTETNITFVKREDSFGNDSSAGMDEDLRVKVLTKPGKEKGTVDLRIDDGVGTGGPWGDAIILGVPKDEINAVGQLYTNNELPSSWSREYHFNELGLGTVLKGGLQETKKVRDEAFAKIAKNPELDTPKVDKTQEAFAGMRKLNLGEYINLSTLNPSQKSNIEDVYVQEKGNTLTMVFDDALADENNSIVKNVPNEKSAIALVLTSYLNEGTFGEPTFEKLDIDFANTVEGQEYLRDIKNKTNQAERDAGQDKAREQLQSRMDAKIAKLEQTLKSQIEQNSKDIGQLNTGMRSLTQSLSEARQKIEANTKLSKENKAALDSALTKIEQNSKEIAKNLSKINILNTKITQLDAKQDKQFNELKKQIQEGGVALRQLIQNQRQEIDKMKQDLGAQIDTVEGEVNFVKNILQTQIDKITQAEQNISSLKQNLDAWVQIGEEIKQDKEAGREPEMIKGNAWTPMGTKWDLDFGPGAGGVRKYDVYKQINADSTYNILVKDSASFVGGHTTILGVPRDKMTDLQDRYKKAKSKGFAGNDITYAEVVKKTP